MRRLLGIIIISNIVIALPVDGFAVASSDCRADLASLNALIDGHNEPRAPQSIIDARTLLAQAKRLLTLKDIKSVLRSRTKISGTKAELLEELGRLLGAHSNLCASNTEHNSAERNNDHSSNTNYKRMKVKELRCELRARGAKVSGRKTKLVQRLIDVDSCNEADDNASQSDNNYKDWSILKATISEPTNADHMNDIDEELPILSTLLFVNKPCGMSTLPTRQVEKYPTFPCLSELVKNWLSTHPDGIELMRQAASNEEMHWKHMLASAAESSNTKRLEKKTRQYEKLQAKQSSFEPRPVHRLDIDTSGIVCIALTPYALRTAGMMFEQKSVQSGGATEGTVAVDKIYVAMVRGEMKSTGTVSHGIGKIWIPDQNTTDGHHEWACDIHDDESVAFCRPGDETRSDSLQFVEGSVRDAFTSYRVLESATESNNSSKDTRVELTPHTGRGHQLRLHMVSLGHPIVGDTMHGDSLETNHKIEKLHLHATNLSIDCYVLDGDDFQRCKASVSSEPWF